MIALKELKACRHGLHQNVETLHDRTVKLYQDNHAEDHCPQLHLSIDEGLDDAGMMRSDAKARRR